MERKSAAQGLGLISGLAGSCYPVLAFAQESVAPVESGFSWLTLLTGLVSGAIAGGVLTGWTCRVQRQEKDRVARQYAQKFHYDTISEEIYGYYYWRSEDGFEVCSQLLRELCGMDDYAASLQELRDAIEEEDWSVLCQFTEQLREEGSTFEIRVHTRHTNRVLECIGLRRGEEHQDGAGITLWFRDITRAAQHLNELADECMQLNNDLSNVIEVLDYVPFPIWQRRADLTIAYCNRRFAEMVEMQQDEVIRQGDIELDKEVRNLARKAQVSRKIQDKDLHIVEGGQRRLYHVTEVPVNDYGGDDSEPLSYVGCAYDVSQREVLQNELARHNAVQSELLDASTNAMAVFGPDTRLKYYNQAFVRLWKLDESQLEEEPSYGTLLETLRENRRLPEQANFPAFKRQQLALFTDLISTQEEFYYLPDGTALRVIVIPHALGGLLFAYEDVTDRLTLERNYNTMIAVQRATLDNLHEAVVVFGEDGRLRLSNPEYAQIWQFTEEDLADSPHISDIVDKTRHFYHAKNEETWQTLRQRIIGLITSREARSGQLERADGSMIDWRCIPLPDGATLVAYRDITDSALVERSLRERNEALLEADRVKTEFLANISYELRSPLTTIMGFSEMLTQQYFGALTDKQQEYVSGIYQSSTQLMALINDILDLASIEAGYMRLNLSKCDIRKMLEGALNLTRERVRDLGLELTLQCNKNIGEMWVDERRVKQIIFNLLSNAIKFSRKGGKITLGAHAEGEDMIQMWVEDNGIGIAPDEQKHVFEKFYKADAGRKQKAGTGLGLSMVQRFSELHEGQVQLESAPGKGTRVTITLPRCSQVLLDRFGENSNATGIDPSVQDDVLPA